MSQDAVNKAAILIMALGISALFLSMIQQFLMALFLAGLFSAIARPLYVRLRKRLGGNPRLASLLTLLLMAVVVLIPTALLAAILIGQALDVSQLISSWIKSEIDDPAAVTAYLQHLPFYDRLMAHQDLILEQAGNVASLIIDILPALKDGDSYGAQARH